MLLYSGRRSLLSRPVVFVTARSYSEKESQPRLRENLSRAVKGDPKAFRNEKAHKNILMRKAHAQQAQTAMDFGFVLRPYMKEYFSKITNLLQTTPNFLEEREIVGTFLGLSTLKQLENGYTVGKIVNENLKKKRPAYAMHLCRMAKNQGTVGMNHLLKYLCYTDDNFKHVFKVYNNLKKWSVPPNERTYSILTHAGVNADCKTYKPNIKLLHQIYKDAMAKATSTMSKSIYTNSTLVSLCRFSLPQNAYEFYKEIPSTGRFSRDEVTYSTMLNLVARQHDFIEFPYLKTLPEIIWSEITSRVAKGEITLTPRLIDSYCNSLCNQVFPNPFPEVDALYKRYFNVNNDSSSGDKFTFTEVQLDILLKACLNSQKYKQAVELYRSLDHLPEVHLDISCAHNFLRNFALVPKLDFQVAKSLFDTMVEESRSKDRKMKLTSVSIKLFWRACQHSEHLDISIIDNIRDKMIPKFRIPVDSHIFSEYASLYSSAGLSDNPPSSQQVLEACRFLNSNISAVSNVSTTQSSPLRIDRGLNNGIVLCRRALDDPTNSEALRSSELKWLTELCDQLQNLRTKLKKAFSGEASFKSGTKEDKKKSREISVADEKRKETPRRYRRVVETQKRDISKQPMDSVKNIQKSHAAETDAPNQNGMKEHEIIEVS